MAPTPIRLRWPWRLSCCFVDCSVAVGLDLWSMLARCLVAVECSFESAPIAALDLLGISGVPPV